MAFAAVLIYPWLVSILILFKQKFHYGPLQQLKHVFRGEQTHTRNDPRPRSGSTLTLCHRQTPSILFRKAPKCIQVKRWYLSCIFMGSTPDLSNHAWIKLLWVYKKLYVPSAQDERVGDIITRTMQRAGHAVFIIVSLELLHQYFSVNKQCFPLTTNQHKHKHKPNFSEVNRAGRFVELVC